MDKATKTGMEQPYNKKGGGDRNVKPTRDNKPKTENLSQKKKQIKEVEASNKPKAEKRNKKKKLLGWTIKLITNFA